MHGKVEDAPVNREKTFSPQIYLGLYDLVRKQMIVRPALIPGVDFETGQIKRAVSGSDFPEMLSVSSVGSEIDLFPAALEEKGRPERPIAIPKPSAGEVTMKREGAAQLAQRAQSLRQTGANGVPRWLNALAAGLGVVILVLMTVLVVGLAML